MRGLQRIGLFGLSMALFSCASPQRIERNAVTHEERAAALEAQGNYYGAQKERTEAMKAHQKAADREHMLNETPVTPPILK